jgi:hypothetical protein
MNHLSPGRRDFGLFIILLLLVAVFAITGLNFRKAPYEDAAMLMRYAQHCANGQGIVWNVDEAPVDGATDFLFMIATAGLIKIGLTAELAVRLLSLLAHGLTMGLIFFAHRRIFDLRPVFAFLSALFVGLSPALSYIAAFFGTPFFVLFTSASWYFILRILTGKTSRLTNWGFALVSFLAALTRPEGILLTMLMLGSLAIVKGLKYTVSASRQTFILFLSLGTIYFFWHWYYFGYPLPNPLYKKGGFHPENFNVTFFYAFKMCFPVLPFFLIGIFTTAKRRLAFACSLPILGFTAAFLFLSNEMNFGARFQYAVMPIAFLSWPLLVDEPEWLSRLFQKHWSYAFVLGILLTVIVLVYQMRTGRFDYFQDGRKNVGELLASYREKGYTMAVSEAGLLPFYSGWRALDTWGLNDQWIAHHGEITEEYLRGWNPDIIMFRAECSPAIPFPAHPNKFMQHVWRIKEFAEHNGYILAAAYGDSPGITHYYYVKQNCPDAERLITEIRNVSYTWYDSGKLATNYAGTVH